jgi:hypothetical protein
VKAEIEERMHVGISIHHDVTAVTAVAAVRSAVGDKFLSVKGNSAVAAVSGLAGDLDAINKITHDFIL